jgi:integrase
MTRSPRAYVAKLASRPCFIIQWRDPATGKLRTKATNIPKDGPARNRREAERLAGELTAQLLTGDPGTPSRLGWADFRERYEREVVPGLAPRTAEKISGVLDRLEEEVKPSRLWDVDEMRLSAFVTKLRAGDRKLAESTIRGHLAHIKSALGWAKRMKLIPQLPAFPQIRRARVSRGAKVMRGRPITAEEFERMLAETRKVVGDAEAGRWEFYLQGLWTSGLRLAESLELYWDRGEKLHPVFEGRYPMLRIPAALEKGHKDRLLPMAPEFAKLLANVPEIDRTGPVFKLARIDGKPGRPSSDAVSKAVSKIGAKANVRVGETKTASAHDLRRAFGERWSAKLMPAQLMELMRHESIETTLTYYVGRNAERTAAALWESAGNVDSGPSLRDPRTIDKLSLR